MKIKPFSGKRFLFFLILSIWFSNPLLAIETNFPALGMYSDNYLETETERLMGQVIMQKIQGSDLLVTDPIINDYLQSLATTFNDHAGLHQLTLHFFAVQSPELNAFAFFGGHVAVHTGLILAVRNESELAAVLAHETAHITQRHLARMIEHNRKMVPLTVAEILAAVALGALGAPDASTHLMTAAMAGHTQSLINFTREHEQEADRIGIKLLASSGFDPKALGSVFECMKQQSLYQAKAPEYFLTHPLFDSRIADAENRARTIAYQPTSDSLYFELIRARLEANKEENAKKKLQRLREKFLSKTKNPSIKAPYAYALALLNALQAKEALPILQQLVALHPNQWVLEMSLAEAKQQLGEHQQASKEMERLIEHYPNHYPIVLQYANFMLQNKTPRKAIQLLLLHRARHVEDPTIHQLLARAYSMAHQPIDMHRSQAEWHLTRGEFKEAILQLDLALEYAENNPRLIQRIQERQAIIKKKLEQQRSIQF